MIACQFAFRSNKKVSRLILMIFLLICDAMNFSAYINFYRFKKCTCFKRIVSCSEIIFRAKNFEEAFCRQSDTLAKVPEGGNWENAHNIICLVLADLIFAKKIPEPHFLRQKNYAKCVFREICNFATQVRKHIQLHRLHEIT